MSEDRRDILLKAALDILKQCNDGPYVKDVMGVTAVWDEAECDGNCLMDEIECLLEDIEHKKKTLNFQKCPISGQQVAQGEKAQYWIEDGAWVHLYRVEVTTKGPTVTKPVPYFTVEQAKADAKAFEAGTVSCFSCEVEFKAGGQNDRAEGWFCDNCI